MLTGNRCLTLFATHYFELTQLAVTHAGAFNLHLSAIEHAGGIVFLHSVEAGPASQSYGLEVARLAGLPAAVIRAARQSLIVLESKSSQHDPQGNLFGDLMESTVGPNSESATPEADSSIDPEVEALRALRDQLEEFDPDTMTPRDALDALYALRSQLRELRE
jgi:DNA mismatch repair protein MutS